MRTAAQETAPQTAKKKKQTAPKRHCGESVYKILVKGEFNLKTCSTCFPGARSALFSTLNSLRACQGLQLQEPRIQPPAVGKHPFVVDKDDK